ncbi:MAG: UDP-glucose 4-epimerase GalE [Oscillospiraceae bacterium]|nr:UDP-glucose 4-epimerase GalE [Oscillospiraceae bacterium]MBQ4000583.1 UDP-glucose 4-epimerase GalE [Oscillospiraceae bacterium]MBQ4239596.1 UDP-glucose 4-epimerase GalE [Oscillospiraceae bacterium]MBQ5412146.1 UDP-glucose 4-epimerase GalE [Oscillospiraceae bacterium]
MKVFVTGGLGYIGSHTAVSLAEAGHDVVIADALYNSSESVLERLEKLTGKSIPFYRIDITDRESLSRIFDEHAIDAVIHFAAYKAVGESQAKPLMYYRNNLDGLITLLEVMKEKGVHRLVFSSSATVYGDLTESPIPETAPLKAESVYGKTKLMCEDIIRDCAATDSEASFAILRYFNPVGAHESGVIGELPNGIPNNLMPYITQVANGIRDHLTVFGNDYDTPDGTGVRDYIHVVDLAQGHVAVLKKLEEENGVFTYNLGCGRGYSVLEIINAFERQNGVKIKYEIGPRRSGDIATCFSDPTKAEKELGWKAYRNIDDMCRDSWRWQQYASEHSL